MDELRAGQYWKTPFIWEPGCPEPATTTSLRFEAADAEWLQDAMAEVMSHSLDESDQFAVKQLGALPAAQELLAVPTDYFEMHAGWWQAAFDHAGNAVGFVLPVTFVDPSRWRSGLPQGTIYYMGVLPQHRSRGHGQDLLAQATRTFIQANCWRIFCDTGTSNLPMVGAFRKAGYKELAPWQRALS